MWIKHEMCCLLKAFDPNNHPLGVQRAQRLDINSLVSTPDFKLHYSLPRAIIEALPGPSSIQYLFVTVLEGIVRTAIR